MAGNRIYIAGKIGKGEDAVKALISELESQGYVVTYDWTLYPIQKPFEGNPDAAVAAEKMAKGVMEADVVIVLCQKEGGVGYHIETGGALIASLVLSFIQGRQDRRIYLVGEGNDRSVFYFHPVVTRVNTIDEIIELGRSLRLSPGTLVDKKA